jgi:diadenosine tetraphosphate (Ap4A) HIT family hydrolase
VLVIPKGPFKDMNDFAANASPEAAQGLMQALGEVARLTGAAEGGYRLISNTGENGHQEVDHLHFHLIGGAPAGPMLKRMD